MAVKKSDESKAGSKGMGVSPQDEIEVWKSKYLRVLADYQNLERRNQVDMEVIRTFAAERVFVRLLPVIDALEQAQRHINDPGLDLAMKTFHQVLAEQGVERLSVIGKPFSPHNMECVEVVASESENVIEESQPGYRYQGKLLRAARVKVGKKKTDIPAQEENTVS